MNMIHIQFGAPGQWDDFLLIATWQAADGSTHHDRYRPQELPAEHASALHAVVAALRGLAEPWQATQVWATLGQQPAESEDAEPRVYVELRVEARADAGGRWRFTPQDYPAFILTDAAVVNAFKHLTS